MRNTTRPGEDFSRRTASQDLAPQSTASSWESRTSFSTRRGKGVGRALIETVAAEARRQGAARYYWLTQEHNAVARVLYDKVAKYNGFLRYEFPL
jgi:ribosomal protein S18 acetylase RimI-like enzyme